ncbi:head-tail connector protein [Gracilimonas sp.]|uniref:head-tail connector protein n=1 Tax=Gracilimonas sp. TaxID=1974203 RepID=UPI002870D682|nr:head-tail connector protein [Gracilimonas sp.]
MGELKTDQRNVSDLLSVSVADTATDPVSVAEAKAYARIDQDTEDSIVEMLIHSASDAFEDYTGKLLIQRAVTVQFLSYGDDILYLPWLPIVSITSVQKEGEDVEYEQYGDVLTVNTSGKIDVEYEAGLFESNTDEAVKLGILKWIVSNYEDRQDVAAMSVQKLPNGSMHHWNRYKTQTI